MNITKTRFSETVEKDQKSLVNSNINLQYSLSLIEVSTDYLYLINNNGDSEKKSKVMEKLISISGFNELNKFLCSKEMLKELLKDHERIISQFLSVNKRYKDKEESNFITTIIEKHKNIARKLRKYF